MTSAPLLDTFGVRTLASDNGGYNPIGYHTGSIWTHDTAICAWNLTRAGFPAHAAYGWAHARNHGDGPHRAGLGIGPPGLDHS